MTDPNTKLVSADVDESANKTHAPKKRNMMGCVLKAVFMLALLAGALYLLQSLLAPSEVEDDKTVQIQKAGASETVTEPEEQQGPKRLTDTISMKQIGSAEHPLDPLMELADRGLEIIDSKYFDYSTKMLSQVRAGGKLHDENLMLLKVRHDRETEVDGTKTKVPFSVYTRFLKPKAKVGQEAIWVRGKNDEKIIGHGTGLQGLVTVRLPPKGMFAMTGNRYPIYQIGFRNLIVKMKEFGTNDRKYGECEVQIERNIQVDGRSCTLLTVTHPEKRDHFEYHIAKIYIDDEYEIITGYEGFLWPEKEGEEPPLLEKYFYLDLKLNPEFQDIDFDTKNPEYEYPQW